MIKIINDPVYGFIHIYSPLILEIIDHPLFQRLRRIRQLGVSELVFPGAIHSRFQHALGAMHLTGKTLESLRNKSVEISDDEFEAAQAAVLLHDIGHGPFSHSLEEVLLPGVEHESVSYQLMKKLNEHFDGNLSLALRIFRNSYERPFFHELVNGQLDIDRMDYLLRDSFFTGVPEGRINVERIIQLLDVRNEHLVVGEKAIYTIENFLNARRLMYWQVYLHRTSLGIEQLLVNIIHRARDLVHSGNTTIIASRALMDILSLKADTNKIQEQEFLKNFGSIDDHDVIGAVKIWSDHNDRILSLLSRWFLERKLFDVELSSMPFAKEEILKVKNRVSQKFNILKKESRYFVTHGHVTNEAYLSGGAGIHILKKDGSIADIADAADLPNIQAMSNVVSKYYLCKPKNLDH